VNIAENLVRLKLRLVDKQAQPHTLEMLDKYITLAQKAGGSEHSTQLRVLHRLMRAPEAARDTTIYNDLVGLEEELEAYREASAREREAMEARPLPKTKKFYKQQRERK